MLEEALTIGLGITLGSIPLIVYANFAGWIRQKRWEREQRERRKQDE